MVVAGVELGHRLGPVAFFVGGWAMKRCRLVLLLSCFVLTGCARRGRRAWLPNMRIPVRCASEITLVECDARVNPPKCRSARVTYRRGCEQVVVGRK